jgi:hypothetical protein
MDNHVPEESRSLLGLLSADVARHTHSPRLHE